MTYLFIADLHLSPNHPRLIRGFLDLLSFYSQRNTQLYILGDWFNAWVGDDLQQPWLDEIVDALKQFTLSGNHIYFLVGNRDFALGQAFLNRFNGQLLADVKLLCIGHLQIRIEHGDALCTDDVSYQRFRKIIRHPFTLGLLKKTPLRFRMVLADGFRNRSKHAQQHKSYKVMDVNQHAVEQALTEVDILIHGHTHRPQIHHQHQKIRIVLGDWREQQGEAKILEMNSHGDWQVIIWKIP